MATSVQPKDKTVNVNGINLHYLDWGTEGKPKVLLLHGLRGHCHSWDDVSAEFCQDYHVLALDQRGRGESDWAPSGDYSSESFVADLEGFCQAVGLDSFILVGHSMGGRNSMAFAGRNAEKIQKMIIIDIGPDLDPKGSARITQEIKDVPEEFDSFEDVFAYQSKQNRFCSEPVLRRRLTYATKELPNGKFGWRYDLQVREQRRNKSERATAEQFRVEAAGPLAELARFELPGPDRQGLRDRYSGSGDRREDGPGPARWQARAC